MSDQPTGQEPFGQRPTAGADISLEKAQTPAGPGAPPTQYQVPGQYQAPGQYYQNPGAVYAPVPKTNTLAIVSLVTSLLGGLSLVAVITGHIALGQIKRQGENGRGLAIAGLVIGYVSMVLVGLFIAGLVVAGIIAANIPESKTGNSYESAQVDKGTPANSNDFGGIALGQNNEVLDTTSDPSAVGLASIGIAPSAAGKPVQVVSYFDFMCPHCKDFESKNGAQLAKWQAEGKITLEYRPISILDRSSNGTKYSTRSANAAACVANAAPAKYKDFTTKLFADQPTQFTAGLSDSQLIETAKTVGAPDISKCVEENHYGRYVTTATATISANGLKGTPAVYVDGKEWADGNFVDFAQGIISAKK